MVNDVFVKHIYNIYKVIKCVLRKNEKTHYLSGLSENEISFM